MKQAIVSVLLFLGLTSAIYNNNPISLQKHRLRTEAGLYRQQALSKNYPSYNFSVPIDHFQYDPMYAPHVTGKFPLRYWFDATYYKPGGPVFLFESGEADASSRIPILDKGIINILSRAHNGLGVIIEHRYYGTSQPMPNLETENLRFLTTDQAMADNAYFAQNIVFKGLEHMDLTSHSTPWIHYGGSYSGAFVAFSRKLYPNVFWGAISSSGVTEAIWDYWKYFEPIKNHAPQDCVKNTQYLTNAMDNIFFHKGPRAVRALKRVFNMTTITHNDDFALTLAEFSIGDWQSTNWDPAISDPAFNEYCKAVTTVDKLNYNGTEVHRSTVRKLLKAGGYGDPESLAALTNPMLNWIGYAAANIVALCPAKNLDACFNTHGAAVYADRSLANNGLICWPYQYCHQWGFLQTGSGVPKNELPLISRLVDLEYSSIICRAAFNKTGEADVAAINKYGGFDIHYPRLAIIDGVADPWRGATPHASSQMPWNRTNSDNEPFYLIRGGAVHHWDENGLHPSEYTADLPPETIRKIQAYEVRFVRKWLAEWAQERAAKE